MVSKLTATKIAALVNRQVKFDVHDLSERTYTHHIRNCSWLSVFYREKKSIADSRVPSRYGTHVSQSEALLYLTML